MLKIRLMRIGAKQRPFYRVVAVDERSKRNGAYVELLGTYNPLTEPKEIKLNQERIDHWLKQGAQPSDGFLRITGKAPQRPPRKPKKERKEESSAVTSEGQVSSPQTPDKIEEPTVVEEMANSSEPEVVGEAPQSEETETSEDTGVEQTHNEDQNITKESENTDPSGTSATEEPSPVAEEEDKKDEGSA